MDKKTITLVSQYFFKAKILGVANAIRIKQLVITQVIPKTKKYTLLGVKIYNEKVAPNIHKGSSKVSQELFKIHKKQNWFKRLGTTMLDNSAGLIMALFSAKIVQNFVEVREFGNLWGLLATHPVVSEMTFEVISFSVEFAVALLAFTLTEHYQEEYKNRKASGY